MSLDEPRRSLVGSYNESSGSRVDLPLHTLVSFPDPILKVRQTYCYQLAYRIDALSKVGRLFSCNSEDEEQT